MRSSNLGKVEVLCGYCGAVVERHGAKFCDSACYRQKQRSQPIEQRFWSKVQKTAGCWLWTAAKTTMGYGQFSVTKDGVSTPKGAHVVAWELANGPVLDGLFVLHRCDVPTCVRPDHLFLGTHEINMQDAAEKGRLHTPRPSRQRLSVTQVHEIRSLVASGEPQFRVAERFGISETCVSLIMHGKRRQHDAPIEKAS